MDYFYHIGEQRIDAKEIVFTKLGVSDKPQERRNQLQTSNPRTLIILGVRPIPIKENREQYEASIHEIFKSTRKSGEWFVEDEALQLWRADNMLNGNIIDVLRFSSEEYFYRLGAQANGRLVRDSFDLLLKRPPEHIQNYINELQMFLIRQAKCYHGQMEFFKNKTIIRCLDCCMKWGIMDTREFIYRVRVPGEHRYPAILEIIDYDHVYNNSVPNHTKMGWYEALQKMAEGLGIEDDGKLSDLFNAPKPETYIDF